MCNSMTKMDRIMRNFMLRVSKTADRRFRDTDYDLYVGKVPDINDIAVRRAYGNDNYADVIYRINIALPKTVISLRYVSKAPYDAEHPDDVNNRVMVLEAGIGHIDTKNIAAFTDFAHDLEQSIASDSAIRDAWGDLMNTLDDAVREATKEIEAREAEDDDDDDDDEDEDDDDNEWY